MFLSQKALQRWAKQGISIDEFDLPVNPQYLQAVADAGATLINVSKWLNGVSVSTQSQAVLEAINALEFVETVRKCTTKPVKTRIFERSQFTEDSTLYGNDRIDGYYGFVSDQINQVNGAFLHDNGFSRRRNGHRYIGCRFRGS
jgi:hypothetical protein